MPHHALGRGLALAVAITCFGCGKRDGKRSTDESEAPVTTHGEDQPSAPSAPGPSAPVPSAPGKTAGGVNTSMIRLTRGPQAKLLSVTTEGDGVSREVVERFAGSRQSAVLGCYRSALESAPGLAGSLETTMEIAADGTVGAVTTTGIPDTALTSCVVKVLGALVLPTVNGGGAVTAVLTWTFEPTPRKPK